MHWYLDVLRKYADFTGRARRQEYWTFALVNLLVFVPLLLLDNALGIAADDGPGVLTALYGLAVLLPSLAVKVRRLHDTGRSAWWLLIVAVPFGGLIMLVFTLTDSDPYRNQYGGNPKDGRRQEF